VYLVFFDIFIGSISSNMDKSNVFSKKGAQPTIWCTSISDNPNQCAHQSLVETTNKEKIIVVVNWDFA
jgi:hypothetical protein